MSNHANTICEFHGEWVGASKKCNEIECETYDEIWMYLDQPVASVITNHLLANPINPGFIQYLCDTYSSQPYDDIMFDIDE